MPRKHRILVVYGTRPEAIKVAPIIRILRTSPDFKAITVSTGQHKEMLDAVNRLFEIEPDYDLRAFEKGQSLNKLSAKIFKRLSPILAEAEPDAVLVQGDTTTVAIAALASFNMQIPVIHLEAGLRSGDMFSPFPEEANRKITTQVSSLNLAPTEVSRNNLLREDVNPDTVAVVRNTVIDALFHVLKKPVSFGEPELQRIYESDAPVLLLTCHRRENWGKPMDHVGRAVHQLAGLLPNWQIVFPAHANPTVRATIGPHLKDDQNVFICDPLNYNEFSHMQQRARIILSDSGGVQEEAPALGKPVLVLRENTERPEAVQSGTVRLIGTDTKNIVREVMRLVEHPEKYEEMAQAKNPFGDGNAASLSLMAIRKLLKKPIPEVEEGPTTVELKKD